MKKRVLLTIILCLAGVSFDYSVAYFSDKLELKQNTVSIGNLIEENTENDEIENQEEVEENQVEENQVEDILSDELDGMQNDSIQNNENLDEYQDDSIEVIDEQSQDTTNQNLVENESEHLDISVEN